MTEINAKWYVLRVRPRHEKAIAQRLSEKYEVFLPLYLRISQWSDRVKKIETPLFSGYLFIHININQKYYVLEEQGVSSFVQFAGKPAIIHDSELMAIRLMLENVASLKVTDGYSYKKGESVKITQGVFAGAEGKVELTKNKARLFVAIEQLGKIISIEIDQKSLKKLRC